MVGKELGFRQKLPRKRDSLLDDVVMLAPTPQTNSIKLTVSQLDVSRSASPVLEPMSARLSGKEARTFLSMDDLEDSPTTRMGARLLV
jgi:glucosamine-6-phosphate deaminase